MKLSREDLKDILKECIAFYDTMAPDAQVEDEVESFMDTIEDRIIDFELNEEDDEEDY